MNLAYSEYGLNIEFKENVVNHLVIENQDLLTQIVSELYGQCNGSDGEFILSDDTKELKIEKEVSIVLEPFSINCNERKVISKLYKELEEISLENMYSESLEVYSSISKFIESLCQMMPYNLQYRSSFSVSDIIKFADVKIEDEDGVLNRIINYLNVMSRICRVRLVIFVNLKSFVNHDDLMEVYKFARYNKIQLLLIECRYISDDVCEKTVVIDRDKCIIEV